jgi:hypothetical protein
LCDAPTGRRPSPPLSPGISKNDITPLQETEAWQTNHILFQTIDRAARPGGPSNFVSPSLQPSFPAHESERSDKRRLTAFPKKIFNFLTNAGPTLGLSGSKSSATEAMAGLKRERKENQQKRPKKKTAISIDVHGSVFQ